MGLFNSPLLAGGRDRLRMVLRAADKPRKRRVKKEGEESSDGVQVGDWKLKMSASGDLVACDPNGKETTVAISVKVPVLPKK